MSADVVAFIANTHSQYEMSQRLVDLLADYAVETVIHLGDVDDVNTPRLFREFDFKAVYGNYDRPPSEIADAVNQVGEHLGNEAILDYTGKQFFIFHGNNRQRAEAVADYPNGIQYVLHGFSHSVERESFDNGEVLCPGTGGAWVFYPQDDTFRYVGPVEAGA